MKLIGHSVLLVAVLLTVGCRPSTTPAKGQTAAASGGVNIAASEQPARIAAIRSIAARYGLVERRDTELERTLGAREARNVFSAQYSKNGVLALYVSNDISQTRFSYMIFREPFSPAEFARFRDSVLAALNPTKGASAIAVPPNNSFKIRLLRGSA